MARWKLAAALMVLAALLAAAGCVQGSGPTPGVPDLPANAPAAGPTETVTVVLPPVGGNEGSGDGGTVKPPVPISPEGPPPPPAAEPAVKDTKKGIAAATEFVSALKTYSLATLTDGTYENRLRAATTGDYYGKLAAGQGVGPSSTQLMAAAKEGVYGRDLRVSSTSVEGNSSGTLSVRVKYSYETFMLEGEDTGKQRVTEEVVVFVDSKYKVKDATAAR